MASRRVQSSFSAAVRAHYLMLLGLAGELSFPPGIVQAGGVWKREAEGKVWMTSWKCQ